MTPFQVSDERIATSPDMTVLKQCNKRMQDVASFKKMLKELYKDSAMLHNESKTMWSDSEREQARDPQTGKWTDVQDTTDVQKERSRNNKVYASMHDGDHMHMVRTTVLDKQRADAKADAMKKKTAKNTPVV